MAPLFALLAAGAADAQVEVEVVPDGPVQNAIGGFANQFEVNAEQFDMWIYGNMNVRFDQNGRRVVDDGTSRLDASLALRMDDVDRACGLSEGQKERLMLAARGDRTRFLSQVEEKRRLFMEVRRDQAKFGNFYQQLQPLRIAYNKGLFGDGSLFARILDRTLTPGQVEQYRKTVRDRARYQFSALVDLLAAKLALALGMSDDQRQQFTRVILAETKLPKHLGQQEFNAVFYIASQVPIDKFKDFLDSSQLKALERQFQSRRGWERSLAQNGFVPGDEPALDPGEHATEGEKPHE